MLPTRLQPPFTCLIQPGVKFAFYVSPKPTEPHKHYTPEAPKPLGYVWLSSRGMLRYTRSDGQRFNLGRVPNGNGKPKNTPNGGKI